MRWRVVKVSKWVRTRDNARVAESSRVQQANGSGRRRGDPEAAGTLGCLVIWVGG